MAAGLFFLVTTFPGWAVAGPLWGEFVTWVGNWKEGDSLDQGDALFSALDAAGTRPGSFDVDVIYGVFTLARRHQELGNWDQCEHLFTRAFRWLEDAFGPEDVILVEPLVELSAIWLAKNEDARAIQALNRGLHIIEREYGTDHVFSESIHERLAEIYRHIGKEDRVRNHERRLVEIWKGGVDSFLVADAVIQKGEALWLWREGRGVEAAVAAARALDILKKTAGPYQDARIVLMSALARNAETLTDEELDGLLKDAMAIVQGAQGERHPGLIGLEVALAHAYQKRGKVDQAKLLFQQALLWVEEFFGPRYPGIATIYFGMGENFRLEGNGEEALSFYDRALSILRDSSSGDTTELALVLAAQASVLKKMGKVAQAEKAQMEYLAILAAKPGVSPDLLEQAREEHKAMVGMLWQATDMVRQLDGVELSVLVMELQRGLMRVSVDLEAADGFIGPKTVKAIHLFEKRMGLPESSSVNRKAVVEVLEHLPP